MQLDEPKPPVHRLRWLAPVLLLALGAGLGPLWWQLTAPPQLATVQPWRDANGALTVPLSAVRNLEPQRGHPGPPHVFVVDTNLARGPMVRRTTVKLGATGPDSVEIRDGLADGMLLVAKPPHGLEDRHRVVPMP